MLPLRIPAVEFKQKDNSLYLFYLKADQLAQLVRSDPRVSTNIGGVQRLLNNKRLKEIAEYISKPETCFPNNIIVSFTKEVRFEPSSTEGMGELIFPQEQGHFGDILDGQHRLYGIIHAESKVKDLPMPITGLMLGDGKSAGRIFADINRLQKPVSKLLLISLQRELGDLIDAADTAAAIVEQLNENPDSRLKGRIKMFQDENSKWLAYDQVVNVLTPLFEKGQRLSFLPIESQLARIKVYLDAVAETFPSAWGDNKKYRLTAAAGFEIIMGLFERAHQRARNNMTTENLTKEDFVKALEPISGTDWTAQTFKEHGFTGSAGKRILLKELLDELPPEG